MRILFFALTLLVHIALTVTLRASTYFYWLIGIILLSMIIGLLLKRNGTSLYSKDLGWGLFYGSITSIAILVIVIGCVLLMFSGMHC